VAGAPRSVGRIPRQATIPHDETRRRTEMPRKVGDRYVCEECGAQLTYEKACPCPEGKPHSEICCGKQMKEVKK
jgi:hypothetical protein